MFSAEELRAMNFNPNEIESFDPTGAIVEELNPNNRGKFTSAGKGKDAVFTIRVVNQTSSRKRVELFNSLNSIVKIPNDSEYTATAPVTNFPYRPFTSSGLLNILGQLAVDPEGSSSGQESAILVPSVALYNDLNGDLCYVTQQTLATWQSAGLTSQNAGADMWVRCNQIPYKRLVEDLSSLVLKVNKTKMQFASANQMKNALEFVRVKSFGGIESNTMEPSEFFKPENNQSLLVDIPRSYYIDKATGIFFDLEASEDMQITFSVTMYRNNGVVIA